MSLNCCNWQLLQYATFLYYLSNTCFKNNVKDDICTKIFLLNRLLNGIDMFYDLNAFQSINSSLSFGGRNKFNDDSTQINYSGDTVYNYKSILNSKSVTNQVEWSSDFTKKFAENEEREFSIALQISGEFEDEETKIMENSSETINLNDSYYKICALSNRVTAYRWCKNCLI